ncbi:MAG: ABC transporter permease subunit [Puniceicoccales bacterium]|nr:ABC transporter permease subunit [Puniceicoccales bacterium]
MNKLIQFGGVTVIAAVFGILVFIAWESLPLFRGARVSDPVTIPLQASKDSIVGVDDSGLAYFACAPDGEIAFYDPNGAVTSKWKPNLDNGAYPTSRAYCAHTRTMAWGLSNGSVVTATLHFSATRDADGKTSISASPSVGASVVVGAEGSKIEQIYFADGSDGKIFVTEQTIDKKPAVWVTRVEEKHSLMGKTKLEASDPVRIDGKLVAPATHISVSTTGSVAVADTSGNLYFFYDDDGDFVLRQPSFQPFASSKSSGISDMDFIFGDVSLALVGESGKNVIFSLVPVKTKDGHIERLWQQTKVFPDLPSGDRAFLDRSESNKAFLVTEGGEASLRYSTTETVRWTTSLDFKPTASFIGGHYDSVNFLDNDGNIHRYRLSDPHPESGWKAFFGKIWYESAPEPAWTWQSSSGNDDFEPKLSLVPLIFGTVKGTGYAMVFSLPISLLAALYMAQFMRPEHKRIVKPIMETMASLPSVVLGFIAALWLAPRVETKVPSLILVAIALPLAAMAAGFCWSRLPAKWKRWIPPGWEFAGLIPLIVLVAMGVWSLGPTFERLFFTWKDPSTGQVIADFRLWWTSLSGAAFEQRNCLVVGFIMGFAVIPVIFTIAEDALSNVPRSLVSASLALGASRWQTAWRVVVPTASAGIFSGVMIGFGRAIGETMIVVMATGNTAVMDWNIFNGMRTLSANIAVELPEAAVASTHYRTLFLGACCLFILTFILNTAAELLRQRLREKYKVV